MESDPFILFEQWFSAAKNTAIDKPHAMTLSSCSSTGLPSSRIVLMSSYDRNGFVFHTNYLSRKGREFNQNSQVALLFWWDELGYQIRIEGEVGKTSAQASDDYFKKRPRGSQIAAWASKQSQLIESRNALDLLVQEYTEKFAGEEVPRPPYWGGYCVKPNVMEFWINRESRLHDRYYYKLDQDNWHCLRLSP